MPRYFCTNCDLYSFSFYDKLFKTCKENHHEIIKLAIATTEEVQERFKKGELDKLGALNPDFEGTKKVFKVKLIGLQELESYTKEAVFQCPKDGYRLSLKCGTDRVFRQKPICIECGEKLYMTREKQVELVREVILQEPNDEVKHTIPFTIMGRLFGEDTMFVEPGNDKIITAVLVSEPLFRKHTNRLFLEIEHIKDVKEKELEVSEFELAKFKSLSRDKLIASFCPTIYGLEKEKEGLLLCLTGGTEVGDIRGDINGLLIGDPSTGKSKLLTFSSELLEKSAYTSGKSASGAGLVAGIDKLSNGTNFPRYGPVVYCSGGMVAIDEIEKMNPQDRSMLHDAMEKQQAYLHKIGVSLTLPAKTIILAAANPRGSRYDEKATVRSNINLPDALLTRFGIIFLMLNKRTREESKHILRHVSHVREIGIDKYCKDNGLLSKVELAKYISYSKTLKPKVSEILADKLHTYFLDLEDMEQEKDNISLYIRGFEDLERLAEASAKTRLSDKVEGEDVSNAISIHKSMLESLKFNTPSGQQQQLMEEDFSKEEILKQCIRDVSTEGSFELPDLMIQMTKKAKLWKTQENAMEYFDKMRTKLAILKGYKGEYRHNL